MCEEATFTLSPAPAHALKLTNNLPACCADFGNAHWKGNTGNQDQINPATNQTGPWVGADLEAGMFYGGGNETIVNNNSQPLTSDFVSLHLKGRTDGFVLKGGDATKGRLDTMYDGPRKYTSNRFLDLSSGGMSV